MSRVSHLCHWSSLVRSFRRASIATGLLSLSLASMGLVGCSDDTPPATSAAPGNAAAGAGAQAAGAMPGAGAMPAGMAGGMQPPGGAGAAMAGAMAPGPGAASGAIAAPGPDGAGIPGGIGPANPTIGANGTPMPPASGAFPGADGNPMPVAGVGNPMPGAFPKGRPGLVTGGAGAGGGAAGAGLVAGGAGPGGADAGVGLPAGAAGPGGAAPGAAAGAAFPGGGRPGAGGPGVAGPGIGGPGGAGPGAGFAGGGPGQGGNPDSPQSPAGTAEFSAESVVIQILKGEATSLEEFISPKCKGILGDFRDGKATPKQIEELQKTFTGVRGVSSKSENGAKVLTLRNADNATITIKVKKEGEDFKVTEMTVKASAAKKGR